MFREFNVVIERDEDGWLVANVPSLPGCHTQAKTKEELLKRIKEAIELYLEVENDISENQFIGVEKVLV